MLRREIQNRESRAFKSLFPVLTYFAGSAAESFYHIEAKAYRPRLLWIKGKGRMVVREVPMTYESLNDGDSFLFDGGLRLLVWHGKESNLMEKNKVREHNFIRQAKSNVENCMWTIFSVY